MVWPLETSNTKLQPKIITKEVYLLMEIMNIIPNKMKICKIIFHHNEGQIKMETLINKLKIII